MALNIPQIRQDTLAERLAAGVPLEASALAEEFGVSVDTIRRDIMALEAGGLARRVRGGAVPVAIPSPPLLARLNTADPGRTAIAKAIAQRLAKLQTILIDGGTTPLLALRHLPALEGRLIITPSPYVATVAAERGSAVHMLGGRLSASGGVNVGPLAAADAARVSADAAVIGACGFDRGLWAERG